MRAIAQMVRTAVAAAVASRSSPRHALVTAYDPVHYSIKAAIQPEGTETGWLPLGTIWAGPGWGICAAPAIGNMVTLIPSEGQAEAWTVSHVYFNDQDRPPASVPSGAFLLQHASGSLLQFNNDGSVNLISIGTLTSSAPQWNHTGPVAITGLLTATQNITAGFGTGDSVTLQHHTHTQGNDSHNDTEVPTNAPTAGT